MTFQNENKMLLSVNKNAMAEPSIGGETTNLPLSER